MPKSIQESVEDSSIWLEKNPKISKYPVLSQSASTDVVVIGGGIHGVIATYLLASAGLKVTLLEKNRLGEGDTGYTTAFISYLLDLDLQTIVSHLGESRAKILADALLGGIKTLNRLVTTEKILCDFETVPLSIAAEDEKGAGFLKREADTAKRLGLDVSFSQVDKFALKNQGLLKAEGSAKFHPLKFVGGLAAKATDQGALIYEQTAVEKIVHGKSVKVQTKAGTITAGYLVAATGSPINSPLFLQSKTIPTKTYVIAGKLPKGTLAPGLYLDTHSPYHYLRIDEGKTRDNFCLGGEDHPLETPRKAHEVYSNLESFLKNNLTAELSVTHRWDGVILTSVDGLPYIGRHPFFGNEFVGTCYGGDGMIFGTLSAIINSDLILGKENKAAKLLSPRRLTGLGRLFKRGLALSKSIVVGKMKNDQTDPAALTAGEGIVIDRGGKKLAISKDESGKVTALSAICTHMNCTVGWNKDQGTWDCPCHGSRFKRDGQVLHGPAVKPLEPHKI